MNYDSARDQGSWADVHRAARQVNDQCSGDRKKKYKAGWMAAGDTERVMVRLSWVGREVVDGRDLGDGDGGEIA